MYIKNIATRYRGAGNCDMNRTGEEINISIKLQPALFAAGLLNLLLCDAAKALSSTEKANSKRPKTRSALSTGTTSELVSAFHLGHIRRKVIKTFTYKADDISRFSS